MMTISELSIVIPSYNPDRESLQELVADIQLLFQGITKEVLIIDDHSAKEYLSVFQMILNKYDDVRVIHLPYNQGQFGATIQGCKIAKYHWIATIDDDLEYNPKDLYAMTSYAGEFQLVYGLPPDYQLEVLVGVQRWLYIRLLKLFQIKRCSSLRLFQREVFFQADNYFGKGISQIDLVFQQVAKNIHWLPINKMTVRTSTRFSWLHLGFFFNSMADVIKLKFFALIFPSHLHKAIK